MLTSMDEGVDTPCKLRLNVLLNMPQGECKMDAKTRKVIAVRMTDRKRPELTHMVMTPRGVPVAVLAEHADGSVAVEAYQAGQGFIPVVTDLRTGVSAAASIDEAAQIAVQRFIPA